MIEKKVQEAVNNELSIGFTPELGKRQRKEATKDKT
jgi:hypothetical protein